MSTDPSASVAAVFTVALLLMHYMPIIESLEVLGLKAKMRQKVGELDAILDLMKRNAHISSKVTYAQLAWANRMTSMPWAQKRDFIRENDSLLRELGLSDEQIAQMKYVFLALVSFDLFQVFYQSLRLRIAFFSRSIDQEQREYFKGRTIDQDDPKFHEFQRRREELSLRSYRFADDMNDPQLRDIGEVGRQLLDSVVLPDADKEALEVVLRKVSDLAAGCWKLENVTEEAEEFLAKYQVPQETMYVELFGSRT